MGVYAPYLRLGDIEDHGSGDVRAFAGSGPDRKFLGRFESRELARRVILGCVRVFVEIDDVLLEICSREGADYGGSET